MVFHLVPLVRAGYTLVVHSHVECPHSRVELVLDTSGLGLEHHGDTWVQSVVHVAHFTRHAVE